MAQVAKVLLFLVVMFGGSEVKSFYQPPPPHPLQPQQPPPLPLPQAYHSIGIKDVADLLVDRCYQKMDPGICRANIPRWHHNSTTGRCHKFVYGGCGANLNNFPTETHCNAACPDKIVCPTDSKKTCYVHKSVCVSTPQTCGNHPYAVCRLTPCSCTPEFVDEIGNKLVCEDNHTESGTDHTTDKPGGDKREEGSRALFWYLISGCLFLLTLAVTLLACFCMFCTARGLRIVAKLHPTRYASSSASADDLTAPSSVANGDVVA